MQNEKCSNKTLRVCGAGGVRKNKGKWQAVVTVADEMTGKKVQRTRNTRVPCLKQSARGKAAAMRVLAEFRSEVELELAEAEEARAAIGAGLPAEQRDDYAALPLSEALEKFIDFCLEMNRITPTTRDDYHYSALHIERDELGLVPVNEVTTDDVNAWSRRRIALGTAPDTLNKSFKLGKRLYAVLLKRSNDTIGRNPFDGALAPRVIARPRNALRSDLVPKIRVTQKERSMKSKRFVLNALLVVAILTLFVFSYSYMNQPRFGYALYTVFSGETTYNTIGFIDAIFFYVVGPVSSELVAFVVSYNLNQQSQTHSATSAKQGINLFAIMIILQIATVLIIALTATNVLKYEFGFIASCLMAIAAGIAVSYTTPAKK